MESCEHLPRWLDLSKRAQIMLHFSWWIHSIRVIVTAHDTVTQMKTKQTTFCSFYIVFSFILSSWIKKHRVVEEWWCCKNLKFALYWVHYADKKKVWKWWDYFYRIECDEKKDKFFLMIFFNTVCIPYENIIFLPQAVISDDLWSNQRYIRVYH